VLISSKRIQREFKENYLFLFDLEKVMTTYNRCIIFFSKKFQRGFKEVSKRFQRSFKEVYNLIDIKGLYLPGPIVAKLLA